MTIEINLDSWLPGLIAVGNVIVVILAGLTVIAGLCYVVRWLRAGPNATAGDDIVGLGSITIGIAFIFIGLTNLGVIVVT